MIQNEGAWPSSPGAEEPHPKLPVGASIERFGAQVTLYAKARLPTQYGEFTMLVFRTNLGPEEQVALIRGDVSGAKDVDVRLHSECLTGDALSSLRCDCREQLARAQSALGACARGILLYLRQEGRGVGLGNKIRAYRLQERGEDTFAANRSLGFAEDARDYRVAAAILHLLGPASLAVWTNNPRKLFALSAADLVITRRVPLVTAANRHNAGYLMAKANVDGHLLPKR